MGLAAQKVKKKVHMKTCGLHVLASSSLQLQWRIVLSEISKSAAAIAVWKGIPGERDAPPTRAPRGQPRAPREVGERFQR